MNTTAPVVTVECHEPEGVKVHNVYPLEFTPETLRKFWEEVRQFRYIFSSDVRQDFNKFCEVIVSGENGKFVSNGLFWVVDDFTGVFYLTRIQPTVDAEVHYTFFDRRQKGRQPLVQEMLKYVFERYQFQRLTAEIPYFASWLTMRFVETVGFKKEGRKRKAAFFNDEWFDVATFGILRDEVLNGKQA